MKNLSRKLRFGTVAVFFGFASAASAADFTFNVPVSLKSILPLDAPAYISCHVYSVEPPPAFGTIPVGSTSMGIGSTPFTLTKGGYAGPPVVVAVNVETGKDPANARGYICTLALAGQKCVVAPDSEPCRGARAAGNSVEVKGKINPR